MFEARKKTCVTCWYWHEGVESYAMWKVYGGGDFAVAIETTAGALRDVFGNSAGIIVGGVEYCPLPPLISNAADLFFHKREEFTSEREVRSVQVLQERIGSVHLQAMSLPMMNHLMKNITASPGMRDSMYLSLRHLVMGMLLGGDITFEPSRFRRSAMEMDLIKSS